MIKAYYDLHLHSCLSPCGDDDMTPANLVNMAAVKGLNVIALSDHNAAGNCEAAIRAGERAGVLVLPAMELNTAEEAHVLCLFERVDQALALEERVRASTVPVANNPEIFGRQQLRDEDDNLLGEEENLLITASGIGVFDVQKLCRELGGLAIPAHIDKTAYSVISTLGFLSPDMEFSTAEVTKGCNLLQLLQDHPELEGYQFIRDSDAHYLWDISEPEYFLKLPELTPAAVLHALGKQ